MILLEIFFGGLSTKNVELEDITFENIVCPAVEVYDVYINFRRSKLGKNGLKSKNARKDTPIIFQFYVRNMSGTLAMVNWVASYRGGEKKQLKIFHIEVLCAGMQH